MTASAKHHGERERTAQPAPSSTQIPSEGGILPTSPSSTPLVLKGNGNNTKPKQTFADMLFAATDTEFRDAAEKYIWLSAYAANNPRSDYHWMADACYAEAERRGKPELYRVAWERASA